MVVVNSLPSPVGTGLVGVAQTTAVVYIGVIYYEIPKIFVKIGQRARPRTHAIILGNLYRLHSFHRHGLTWDEVEATLDHVVDAHPTTCHGRILTRCAFTRRHLDGDGRVPTHGTRFFFHRAPLIQTLFMEFVVACGRRRGPPLESLAAHGAVIHLVKGFWVDPTVGLCVVTPT